MHASGIRICDVPGGEGGAALGEGSSVEIEAVASPATGAGACCGRGEIGRVKPPAGGTVGFMGPAHKGERGRRSWHNQAYPGASGRACAAAKCGAGVAAWKVRSCRPQRRAGARPSARAAAQRGSAQAASRVPETAVLARQSWPVRLATTRRRRATTSRWACCRHQSSEASVSAGPHSGHGSDVRETTRSCPGGGRQGRAGPPIREGVTRSVRGPLRVFPPWSVQEQR